MSKSRNNDPGGDGNLIINFISPYDASCSPQTTELWDYGWVQIENRIVYSMLKKTFELSSNSQNCSLAMLDSHKAASRTLDKGVSKI